MLVQAVAVSAGQILKPFKFSFFLSVWSFCILFCARHFNLSLIIVWSFAAFAGRLCSALTAGTACFLLGHLYKTTWRSCGLYFILSCQPCLTVTNSSMSGFPRGTTSWTRNIFLSFNSYINLSLLIVFTFLFSSSIESHAEHGGTLNEHQLTRLVRYARLSSL